MKHITLIAGARPNFMKIAPIIHAIEKKRGQSSGLEYSLVHTGQHYDEKMSGKFFKELDIPQPDVNLGAGGGSQAEWFGGVEFKHEAASLRALEAEVVGEEDHFRATHFGLGVETNQRRHCNEW